MTTFREGRERNVALGVWGAVGGFGAAAGVLLGGVLTDALSWEWIFFVNVPVGLAALALTPFILTESRDARAKSYDVLGAVSVTGGLSLLVYAFTQATNDGWTSPESLVRFGISAALLVFFVLWERRHAEPLVAFGLFRVQHRDRGERGRIDHGHGDVRDVPDAHALHAAGARLLGDGDGHRLPRRRRVGDRHVRRRGAARHADRREAGARHRA